MFAAVKPGTWVFRVVRPKSLTQTGPTGGSYALRLTGATTVTGKDFGFRKRA